MVQLPAAPRLRIVVALAAAAGIVPAAGAGAGQAPAPPPVELTAEQDHRRLMDLLGIEKIRRGADPRNPQAPNAVRRKRTPGRTCPIRSS